MSVTAEMTVEGTRGEKYTTHTHINIYIYVYMCTGGKRLARVDPFSKKTTCARVHTYPNAEARSQIGADSGINFGDIHLTLYLI